MAEKLNVLRKKKKSMMLWQVTFYDQNEIILKAARCDLARLMQPAGRVFGIPGVDAQV